jgi:hypothetical protein
MSTPNEETNAVPEPIFDPFPEPQTIPSGWDLSGIAPDPMPGSSLRGATNPPTGTSSEA